jgi:hypothetical protein
MGQELNKEDKQDIKAESSDNKAPSISLPKGGGAIRGIGEKFSMNPVTGTGSLSVPIFTTPGRSDFFPKLSLAYDSGAGNGPFGLGWNLSVPEISRKTDKGLPRYRDAVDSDTFILSGAEDLVPVVEEKDGNETYIVKHYRPRIEGLFARIERRTGKSNGDVYWRSISKDNVTTIYGKSPACRIADPDDSSRVFKWLIEESRDDKGNVILYEYTQENNQGVSISLPREKNRVHKPYANQYLKRIKYGNKTPGKKDFLFEVVFDYGEHGYTVSSPGENNGQEKRVTCRFDETVEWKFRPDAFSYYRAGFEIRTQRLCQRVLMFHHFPELGNTPCLVRSTDFHYRQGPVLTFMDSVTQSGYIRDRETGQYKIKSLPPLEFTYTEARIDDQIQSIDSESLENLPIGLDGSLYQWVDLDGEGISGILTQQGEGWFYKRSLGNISYDPAHLEAGEPPRTTGEGEPEPVRFAHTVPVVAKPSPGNLQGPQTRVMDLAGDGQQDLVLLDDPLPGFFERTHDKNWESFVPFSSCPTVNWNDPNLRFVDLNGDGHADILITEDKVFTWYPSEGEAGFGPSVSVDKV